MIFKTIENNDIDKWTAKIGLFGKSFNDVIDSINKRKLDIDNLMSSGLVSSHSDAKKQVGGLFSYLYSKTDIKSQLIDVDSVFPKIDESQAKSILQQINDIENGVDEEIKSFQELYDTGNKQKQWIAKYAQETQGQIRSTEGLISANQKARASAIAHNNALKQQTLLPMLHLRVLLWLEIWLQCGLLEREYISLVRLLYKFVKIKIVFLNSTTPPTAHSTD